MNTTINIPVILKDTGEKGILLTINTDRGASIAYVALNNTSDKPIGRIVKTGVDNISHRL